MSEPESKPVSASRITLSQLMHLEHANLLGNVHGAYGAKGIGELPMDGPAPAIVNAIGDALGVSLNSIPLLPEDIYAALAAESPRAVTQA